MLFNALLGELLRDLDTLVDDGANFLLDARSPGLVRDSVFINNGLKPIYVLVHVIWRPERKDLALLLAEFEYWIYIIVIKSGNNSVD